MAWDFETDPEFQKKLDWIEEFMEEKVEPLSNLGRNLMVPGAREKFIKPLQDEVRAQGLWACHLGPELGGQGYGQLKLGLMNEKLGRNSLAPSIFGCQAPDTGNAEIIAHYGTPEQKEKWLWPLLNGEIRSAFSMSEPAGGSDPTTFKTRAEERNGKWVINGEKYFSSGAYGSTILIVYAVTDPDHKDVHQKTSIFIVPTKTPGVEIVRGIGVGAGEGGGHAYMRYTNVEVGPEALLGPRGGAFLIAQTRLSGGRVHHAMRTVGACQRAFDLMCRRAVSRQTRDGRLSDLGVVQEQIADAWIQLQQFRLQVLHTAWLIDKHKDYNLVRKDIAAIKVAMPKVYHDIAATAAHLHGAMGVSNEMPFMGMMTSAMVMGIADGPTEVHKATVAKQVLKAYRPDQDLFPNYHLPKLKEAAMDKYGTAIDELKAENAKTKETAPA